MRADRAAPGQPALRPGHGARPDEGKTSSHGEDLAEGLLPLVSVIVPCLNEVETIGLLLDALAGQAYPRDRMEVVIADGMSDDGTRARISRFVLEHPEMDVRVVDNPAKVIPVALNRALAVSRGEIVIRMDAHAVPLPDHLGRCVSALREGRGDCVGGVLEVRARGTGRFARSIAVAVSHPVGVGDARHRYSGRAGPVDSVPFVGFRRELVDRVGTFDESLHANQDFEFNYRVRRSGGRVWLDPSIRTVYFCRPTLGALARQYRRYGSWKVRMLRREPQNRRSLRWRQALPPAFVAALAGLAAASAGSRSARRALSAQIGLYGAVLAAAGAHAGWRERRPAHLVGVPAAIAVMQLSWGAGFLWSLASESSASPAGPATSVVPRG